MLFIIAGVILIDQLTKYYIEATLSLGTSIPVLPDIFHITYILNPGAAFGILENQRGFFIVIAIVMLLGIAYFYSRLKREHVVVRLGTALLVGGAVGNLIDRIKTGYVVDFFDFRIWPIFNVADIGIVTGVGLIMYALFFLVKQTEEEHSGE